MFSVLGNIVLTAAAIAIITLESRNCSNQLQIRLSQLLVLIIHNNIVIISAKTLFNTRFTYKSFKIGITVQGII